MIFNEAKSRMIDEALFGVACYERGGESEDGEALYYHQGCVETAEIAECWLRGEDVQLLRIYPRREGQA